LTNQISCGKLFVLKERIGLMKNENDRFEDWFNAHKDLYPNVPEAVIREIWIAGYDVGYDIGGACG